VPAARAEAIAVSIIAVVGFVVVSYLFFPWHRSNADVPLPKSVAVKEGAMRMRPVTVPADFGPSTLGLPTQRVSAPIDAVGLDAHESLVIPGDVHRVGYYTGGGVLDGNVGELLIAGHVSYIGQGTGALGRIGELRIGDPIITRGHGRPRAWRVISLTSYLKADGLPNSLFRSNGSRLLTLVTCGGTLDPHAHSYLSNIVVTAMPEPTVLAAA
jgi:hypothetical protein